MTTEKNLNKFFIMWIGQTGSVIGSQITSFALGVWIFQQTGSALLFGMTVALGMLPGIFLAPVAGVWVDRLNRRTVMLVSDIGDAIFAAIMVILLFNNALEVWHIYIIVILSSIMATFQQLAYMTAVSQMVPEEKLGNINGLVQLSSHGAAVFVPLVSTALYAAIGLEGIIIIDFLTFGFAVVTLLFIRIPDLPRHEDEKKEKTWKQIKDAWAYLKTKQGLLPLLYFFAISSFAVGFVQVLFRPLVLSMFDLSTLGWLMTWGGIGGLIGALLMAIWGGPNKHVNGVLGFTILSGLSILLCGWAQQPWLVGVAAFAFSFTVPLVTSCSQVIWQKSIPHEMQGRVFSFRTVISTSFIPLGLVLSPFLAEYVFEPMMLDGGELAPVLGSYLGTGPGRGMAILFIVMGLLISLVAILSFMSSNIRSLGRLQKSDKSQQKAQADEDAEASEQTSEPKIADEALSDSTGQTQD